MIAATYELAIDIGEMPIVVRTDNAGFAQMLEDRYGEFVVTDRRTPIIELEIELVEEPGTGVRAADAGLRAAGLGLQDSDIAEDDDDDLGVRVRVERGRWIIERDSYRAEWDPQTSRGWVRQTANPYAIDGVLRILHSLVLAREGGFLVHAASAVRYGRAFVFAGVSGTGKTTISRLAPPDVTLLTDEISYLRPMSNSPESEVRSPGPEALEPVSRIPCPVSRVPAFTAFGTPFAGELARIGKKIRAPLAALFLLQQGAENRIETISESEAARQLLRHVLFFAKEEEVVLRVFDTICAFVQCVPVRRLVFTQDARVWELIG